MEQLYWLWSTRVKLSTQPENFHPLPFAEAMLFFSYAMRICRLASMDPAIPVGIF